VQTEPLIEILEKLLKLHKSLRQLGIEKTNVIKQGKVEELQALMKNERSHISAIQMVEKERQKMISELIPDKEEATLAQCLPLFEPSDREKISAIQQELIVELVELQAVNGLNQELLEQSLQWVHLNLDLLLPDDQPNYKKEHHEEDSLPQISLFDSKA